MIGESSNDKLIVESRNNNDVNSSNIICTESQSNVQENMSVAYTDEYSVPSDIITLENCTNEHILHNENISERDILAYNTSINDGSLLSPTVTTNSVIPIHLNNEINQAENKCSTQLGEIDSHINSACPISQEQIVSHSVRAQSFNEAFTLPPQYLPKKKQNKLKATGKPKLSAVGTSDDWWRIQMEKEQQQKMKEEKAEKKRILQDEKKKLAEEKKKLQKKINEIQQKMKSEKI